MLGVVIGGVPAGSQVVTASRAEQPHLAHARAFGESVEIDTSDLAFDATGTARSSPRSTSHSATRKPSRSSSAPRDGPSACASLPRSCATAVRRGVGRRSVHRRLPLSGGADEPSRAPAAVPATDRGARHPVRAIMRRDPRHGRCRDLLREVAASNAFLVPLDRRREWYRYHALFREFLLGELARVEPELIPELRMRAASWFEGARGARRRRRVPARRAERTEEGHPPGRRHDARRLSARTAHDGAALVPDDRRPGDQGVPPLAVFAGWISALAGQADEADRWAAVLAERDLRSSTRRRLGIARVRPGDAQVVHVP